MDMKSIPKVELHYHLDGSINLELLAEFMNESNDSVSVDEIKSLVQVDSNCKSLREYLKKFQLITKHMQTDYALEKTAYHAVKDTSSHNVKYLEVRFAPWLHVNDGLSIEEIIKYVLLGLKKGENEFGTIARAILVCLRNDNIEKNIEIIEQANHFLGKGVVGVDLAGDENKYPPRNYKRIFERAQDYKLPITIHAGEAAGPESIRDAIELLGAKRIGHGISLIEDYDLINIVKEKNITLEICPTSNVQTKAVNSLHDHPLRRLYDMGVPITINTDNCTVSNTNITKEYQLLADYFKFTQKDLQQIVYTALEASFAEKLLKKDIKKIIKDEFTVY